MKKRILILAVLALVAVVAVLGGIKGLQIDRMIAHGKQMVPPPEAVTTAPAVRQSWESVFTAVGSLSAVQGVTVTAELTGKVAQIAFEPGGSPTRASCWSSRTPPRRRRSCAPRRPARPGPAEPRAPAQAPGREDRSPVGARQRRGRLQAGRRRRPTPSAPRSPRRRSARRSPAASASARSTSARSSTRASRSSRCSRSTRSSWTSPCRSSKLPQLKPGLPVRVTTDALPGQVRGPHHRHQPGGRRRHAQHPRAGDGRQPGRAAAARHVRHVSVVLPATRRCSPSRPRPSSTRPTATRSSSSRTGTTRPAGRRARPCASSSRSSGTGGRFRGRAPGLKAGDTIVSTGVFKLRNGQAVIVDNTLAPEFKLHPEPSEE